MNSKKKYNKNKLKIPFSRASFKEDTKQHAKMTLDEAIEHAEEKIDNTKCGQEHKQLAQWLIELRRLRQKTNKKRI